MKPPLIQPSPPAFLGEFDDTVAIEDDIAEARQRRDRGNGHELSMALVKGQETVERHVGHAVAVGQHEGSATEQRRQAPDAAAGKCLQPGIDEMNLPGLLMAAATFHAASAKSTLRSLAMSAKCKKKFFTTSAW